MGQEELELQLRHDRKETSQLVEDLRDFLQDPAYEQAVQDAVTAAGVADRLRPSKQSADLQVLPLTAQQQQLRGTAGTLSSAQSTITFDAPTSDELQEAPSASGRGAVSSFSAAASQARMSHELKQEVESLLQRTDSILSRSSGHSTLHGASSGAHLPGLTINTASSSPYSTQQEGGFDFETGSAAAETPTFSKPNSRGAGGVGNFRQRLTVEHEGGLSSYTGRRRTLTPSDNTAAGRISNSSMPPIGGSSSGAGLPVPDYVGQLGPLQEEAGPDGRHMSSLASRLSQQALSEIKEKLDGPEAMSRFSSGLSSNDQTHVVLNKSASWSQRAAGRSGNRGSRAGDGSGTAGSPIYANFAPLEQLVDAALTDTSAGTGPGSIRGTFAGQLGGGGAAGGGGRGSATSVSLLRAASSHTSHKVALGYMLQPDYIHNSTLSRLKSELQGLSKASAGGVPGGSSFDVKLLELTARLSQWAQQERLSGETFQQLLDSILDGVFGRLSPSRGRLQPPSAAAAGAQSGQQQQQHTQQSLRPQPPAASKPDSLTAAATGLPQAVAGPATANRSGSIASGRSPGPDLANSNGSGRAGSNSRSTEAAAGPDTGAWLLHAGTRRSTRVDCSSSTAAAAPKPTDSMLRSAFAKLALGQAKLRQAVKGGSLVSAAAAGSAAVGNAGTAVSGGIPRVASGLAFQQQQSDIGVAQRFSCCSSSSASSRQQSQAVEALDAVAVQQIQVAMQAAAATAAGAAAERGAWPLGAASSLSAAVAGTTMLSPPRSSAVLHSANVTKYNSSNAAGQLLVVNAGQPSSHTSFGSPSMSSTVKAAAAQSPNSYVHSPGVHRQQLQQQKSPMRTSMAQQEQQCQQQWRQQAMHQATQPHMQSSASPKANAYSPGASHPRIQQSPGQPSWAGVTQGTVYQPWLQQHPQQHPQQQQLQQQQELCQHQQWETSPVQAAAAAAPGVWDAWPSSKPSRWSPGRDTLQLARQAYKRQSAASTPSSAGCTPAVWLQRESMQQQQQQQQQHHVAGGDTGFVADGSPGAQRCLFGQDQQPYAGCVAANAQQQQQQQQQQPCANSQGWLLASPHGRSQSAYSSPVRGPAECAASHSCTGPCCTSSCQTGCHGSPAGTAGLHGSSRGLPPATAWSPGPLGSRRGHGHQPELYCSSSNGSPQPACAFSHSPGHVGQLAVGTLPGQSVRVSTAAGVHGGGVVSGHRSSSSPRRLRLPLTGGCLDVYPDAVEVHSQHGSPMRIDVLPATAGP